VKPLRTVFAGTPEFAVPALAALIETPHRPLAVLCQPDRPAGRGRRLQAGPVKRCAQAADIPVLQPLSLKQEAARQALIDLEPDLIITAAYGLLLPQAVLELPRDGCWNLHASLLPRWRGASPINQAILAGDRETGMTLMQMDRGLDTGPILLQAPLVIDAQDTAGQLHDRLSRQAAELLLKGLDLCAAGQLPAARPQDDREATHAPLIRKDDARLDWNLPAEQLDRQIRAYHPWPVAFGEIEGQVCRVHRARVLSGLHLAPGQLLRGSGRADMVVIGCGRGALALEVLQEPGRRALAARDWLNGHPGWL